jgi:hypothetical protein
LVTSERVYKSMLAFAADAFEVDLQTTVGGTEFGEILVKLGDPAAQVGFLLHQHYVLARFSGFQGSGEPGDAATDHNNAGLVLIRH